jgi:hypothetical protein
MRRRRPSRRCFARSGAVVTRHPADTCRFAAAAHCKPATSAWGGSAFERRRLSRRPLTAARCTHVCAPTWWCAFCRHRASTACTVEADHVSS